MVAVEELLFEIAVGFLMGGELPELGLIPTKGGELLVINEDGLGVGELFTGALGLVAVDTHVLGIVEVLPDLKMDVSIIYKQNIG